MAFQELVIRGFSPTMIVDNTPTQLANRKHNKDTYITTGAYLNYAWDGEIQGDLQKMKSLSSEALHSSTIIIHATWPLPLVVFLYTSICMVAHFFTQGHPQVLAS